MDLRVGDDEAISPVLGTILMVAITVVLAATVFVIVGPIGQPGPKDASDIAFYKDVNERTVRVVRASPGTDWFEKIDISGTCTPLLNGAPMPSAPGTYIHAGDVLGPCAAGETLSIAFVSPNTLLYETTFT